MNLTYAQKRLMEKAPIEWGNLPGGVGCTNSTLEALERRKLVETRVKPGERCWMFSQWQWRKLPQGDTQ